MKIWQGYGSDHSMNLVMIGHFKNPKDAEETQKLIEQLSEGLRLIFYSCEAFSRGFDV